MAKSQEATIKDLKVDTLARITGDQRKEFVKILRKEIDAKRSLFQEKAKMMEEETLEQYKQKVGFEELRNRFTALTAQREDVETKIKKLGLNTDGTRLSYGLDGESRQSVKKLDRLFEVIRKNQPSEAIESKIIARMLIAQTVGEAVVILKEVMGNELIPALTIQQLEYKPSAS